MPSGKPQDLLDDKKKQEEMSMLEYMKSMYQTHGMNLLNIFRSGESIRIALGQIEDNDRLRAEQLRRLGLLQENVTRISGTSSSGNLGYRTNSVTANGEASPMDAIEGVVPHTSKISL